MAFFLIILLLNIILCFQSHYFQKKYVKWIILSMWILCAFRASSVGADTHNYINYASEADIYTNWGFCYDILRIISVQLHNPQLFIIFMAILTYYPLYYLICHESKLPAVSSLLYMISVSRFFLETFNIARQSIAIIFFLYAILAFSKKQVGYFFFFSFCAYLFHPIILIAFPVFLLYKMPISKSAFWILMVISWLIGLTGTGYYVNHILNDLSVWFNPGYGLAYFSHYADKQLVLNWNLTGKLVHSIPICALCILSYNNKTKNNLLFKFLFTGTLISILLMENLFCDRFVSTLVLTQILIVPDILQNNNIQSKLMRILIVLFVFYYIFILIQQQSAPLARINNVLPYKFFFNE